MRAFGQGERHPENSRFDTIANGNPSRFHDIRPIPSQGEESGGKFPISEKPLFQRTIMEDLGTGGGGFRFLYATFLQEAAGILGDERLESLSWEMRENGDRWREISLLAARMGRTYSEDGTYAHLAIIYYVKRNYEDAIPMLEKAVDLGSTSVEYRYELGLSYSYLGDCEQAIIWFEQTLILDPSNEIALQGLRDCDSTP